MSDRMKGMKLGSFSGIKKTSAEPAKPLEPETPAETEAAPNPQPESALETKSKPKAKTKTKKTTAKSETTTKAKAKVGKKTQAKEELVTVNIKIRKDQKAWLTDTASTVR
ncbi:MAG: hypothetical protein AAFQ14_07385, partial [Cyanobacteria bacterium J06621_12]